MKLIESKSGIEIINKWENNKKDKSIKEKYYYKENNLYIGIDNSTFNCWVEEFENLNECKKWLVEG